MTATIDVRNPYTGAIDYHFTDPAPVDVAMRAAELRANQPAWAERDLADRLAVMSRFAEAVMDRREAILEALIADTGRVQVARMEVDAVAGFAARAAKEAPAALASPEPRPAHIPVIHGSANRIPYGLVGNISPWNFPIILSFLDTFPALAGGNAVLIKPSEVTPRWVEPMRAAIADVPEIAAVLDIVVGTGSVGAALVDNVDAVVFTGSVETGRKVAEGAARNFIPAFLELGGKDPAVVLPGADMPLAARTLAFSSTQSAGQACQSLERIYVPREAFDAFVSDAVAMAESMEINYPDINRGVVGPFIFAAQASKVMQQLADARAGGATIHCGGELLNYGGLWMRPTVVTGVTHDMTLMQDETFGPVMPIMAYDSVDEAIKLANDSRYGLSAAVFGATLEEASAVAKRIRAGAVSVNDAALTVMIHDFEHDSFGYSGLGASRAGRSAYTRFTREQSVMANISGEPLIVQALSQ